MIIKLFKRRGDKEMKKPIIGITGNETNQLDPNKAITRTFASKAFSEAVKEAGGIPIILPIGDVAIAKDYVDMIDKLIITGGQNVLPDYYGEEQTIDSDDYHRERDEFELALVAEAIKQNKPIFSVCRGTQLVNVAMGGTLEQSIKNHWQSELGSQTTHEISVLKNSELANIFGSKNSINSFHRQAIKDLAPSLEVIAVDPKDNTIEAVRSNKIAYLGVQWHPELLIQEKNENFKLFQYVVNEL